MSSSEEFVAVGFRFRNYTPECLRTDDFIRLRPEPTNKYDPNAIKIMVGDEHVAYVARDYCEMVQEVLDSNCIFGVTLLDTYQASAKLRIHWSAV